MSTDPAPCPHEVSKIAATLDQERMTLYAMVVECTACGALAHALDDEVVLGPWSTDEEDR
jgi:hypothetical protein